MNHSQQTYINMVSQSDMTVARLKEQCKLLGLKGYSKLKREALIKLLSDWHLSNNDVPSSTSTDRVTTNTNDKLNTAMKDAARRLSETTQQVEEAKELVASLAKHTVDAEPEYEYCQLDTRSSELSQTMYYAEQVWEADVCELPVLDLEKATEMWANLPTAVGETICTVVNAEMVAKYGYEYSHACTVPMIMRQSDGTLGYGVSQPTVKPVITCVTCEVDGVKGNNGWTNTLTSAWKASNVNKLFNKAAAKGKDATIYIGKHYVFEHDYVDRAPTFAPLPSIEYKSLVQPTVDLENATEMWFNGVLSAESHRHIANDTVCVAPFTKTTNHIHLVKVDCKPAELRVEELSYGDSYVCEAPACSLPVVTSEARNTAVSTVEVDVRSSVNVELENDVVCDVLDGWVGRSSKVSCVIDVDYTNANQVAINLLYIGEGIEQTLVEVSDDWGSKSKHLGWTKLNSQMRVRGYYDGYVAPACKLPTTNTQHIKTKTAPKPVVKPTMQHERRNCKGEVMPSAKDSKTYTGVPNDAPTHAQLRTYNQQQTFGNMSPRHQAGSRANLYANSKARQVEQRTSCAINTYTRSLGETERQALRNLKEFGNTAKSVANNVVAFGKGFAEGLRGGVNARGERVNYNESRLVERPKFDRKALSY